MANYRANRMLEAKPSFIRETLKYAVDPTVLSFAGGNPDADYFPLDALAAASSKVLSEQAKSTLQYSITEGYIPLREKLVQRMAAVGVQASLDELIITSGAQQGLEFTGKLCLDAGDVVLVESPTYIGAINAFKLYQPKFVEVEMDEEGMRMDMLEAKLQEYPNAKFIYTIPDFQNPTGRVMTRERRQRLVDLAAQYDVMIVEDNPYYDLRFEGEAIPPVKAFDKTGHVIYLGSFSKILCPGFRVGWVVAPKDVIRNYVILKQASDLSSNELAQRTIDAFMNENDLNAHIAFMNQEYKRKKDAMLKGYRDFFPSEVKATNPQGGLFLWMMLPDGCNAMDIFQRSLETERVIFVPGEVCFPCGGHENTLRMCFSTTSADRITDGMERLAKVFRDALR